MKHDEYLAGLTKQKAELTATFEAQIRKRTMEVQNEDNEREEKMREEHRAQVRGKTHYFRVFISQENETSFFTHANRLYCL